jgi:anti-sigma B factor antagonist
VSPLGPAFGAAISLEDGCTVVAVRGELDLATAPTLEEYLLGALQRGGRRVVLDLEHLEFMDAAGLRVIVAAARRLRTDRGELLLRAPSPMTRKLLEITRLDERLTIESADAGALTRVGHRAEREPPVIPRGSGPTP